MHVVLPNRAIQFVTSCGNWTEHDSTKEPVVRRSHGLRATATCLQIWRVYLGRDPRERQVLHAGSDSVWMLQVAGVPYDVKTAKSCRLVHDGNRCTGCITHYSFNEDSDNRCALSR